MKRTALLAPFVIVALFSPSLAQVRYTDDEAVVHFVDSINDVPEKYRARAVGGPTPPPTPTTREGAQPRGTTDWDKKAQDAKPDADQEKAAEKQRAQMEARCDARETAWSNSLPKGAPVDSSQMAAALGPDCDVDALLARRAERLKTSIPIDPATRAECNQRLATSGADQRKIQTANMADAQERSAAWLEIARRIGNECADLLLFGRP